MEIVLLTALIAILGLLAIAAWVHVRIEQHKIQYGMPERMDKLEAELKRQAEIVNRLDQEGLEHVKRKADEIAGQLRDISLGQALR